MTHYQTLGVPRTAGRREIRAAYLAQARSNHPDTMSGADAGEISAANVRMAKVNEAWEVLSHPDARRAYDATLPRIDTAAAYRAIRRAGYHAGRIAWRVSSSAGRRR